MNVTKKKSKIRKLNLRRKGLERLDILLIVIEALDINGSQALLWTSEQLGYGDYFRNPVDLWKSRSYNPLRRANRRGSLNSLNSEALIHLICKMSERLYPLLRKLLSSKEHKQLSDERWLIFSNRFCELVKERLNTRRGAVQKLINFEGPNIQLRYYVLILALSVGEGGVNRLRASLQDQIV